MFESLPTFISDQIRRRNALLVISKGPPRNKLSTSLYFFSSNSKRKYRHSPSQPSPRLRKFTIFFERRFFRPHPTAAVTTATAQCTKKTVVKKYESDICQQVGSWLRQSCPGNRSTRLYPAIRPQLNALHSTEAHFVCVRLP